MSSLGLLDTGIALLRLGSVSASFSNVSIRGQNLPARFVETLPSAPAEGLHPGIVQRFRSRLGSSGSLTTQVAKPLPQLLCLNEVRVISDDVSKTIRMQGGTTGGTILLSFILQFIPSRRSSGRAMLCSELLSSILRTGTEDADGIAPEEDVEGRGHHAGELAHGASQTIAQYLLEPDCKGFANSIPKVHVTARRGNACRG